MGTMMQREMELVRVLLSKIESMPPKAFMVDELAVDGYEVPEIRYHVLLLSDAGFVELGDKSVLTSNFVVRRLTWAGADFVASVRSDEVWAAVKQHIGGGLKTVGFGTLQSVILKIANASLGGSVDDGGN